MMNATELRKLEVIDSDTAERLGFVCDMEIDFESGKIESIIIPRKKIFFKQCEYVIPWKNIVALGKDVILVRRETPVPVNPATPAT